RRRPRRREEPESRVWGLSFPSRRGSHEIDTRPGSGMFRPSRLAHDLDVDIVLAERPEKGHSKRQRGSHGDPEPANLKVRGEVLRRTEAGEEFTVTVAGRPVAPCTCTPMGDRPRTDGGVRDPGAAVPRGRS